MPSKTVTLSQLYLSLCGAQIIFWFNKIILVSMFLCCCPSKVNQEQPENGDPDLEENKQGK